MTNIISLDTETALIQNGEFSPKLVCMSWYSARNGNSGVVDRTQAVPLLKKMIASGATLVLHNAPFDMLVLAEHEPSLYPMWYDLLDAGRVKDTQLRQKMADIATGCYRGYETEDGDFVAHGYSLAQLGERHLGLKLDKDTWRLRYGELIDTPIEQWPAGAIEYARMDADTTAKVFTHQTDFGDVETIRTWFDFVLYRMSRTGLAVSPDAVAELDKKTQEAADKLQWTLQKSGYLRVANLKELLANHTTTPEWTLNTGQVRESVELQLANKGITTPRLSETGKVKIDKINCRLAGTPALMKFADYKELSSVINKDIVFLKEAVEAGCVQTRFDSMLSTGRTSSSNPNIQNIRRFPGIRECFVPRPGMVFLDCDYGSAELHTLAQTCLDLFGESRLAEVLNSGKDAHVMMGADIAGMSYDELDAQIKSGKKTPKKWRTMAKGPNFGLPGGMGAAKLVEYIEAQGGNWRDAIKVFKGVAKWEQKRKRAKDERVRLDDRVFAAYCLKIMWAETWPEMKKFFEYVHQTVQSGEPMRLTRSGRERLTDKFTAACNYMFQGPAADGAALAARALHRACYEDTASLLYGCSMVHFIHDQFILEAPTNIAEFALPEVQRIMKEEFDRIVPDVPISVSGDILTRWEKT